MKSVTPFVCFAAFLLIKGCSTYPSSAQGSWVMDNPLDRRDLMGRVTEELHSIGYGRVQGKRHSDEYCRWIQVWSERKPGPDEGRKVSLRMPCNQNRVVVHLRNTGGYWTEEQLDHYYFLRNELFPQIMGREPEALNIKTVVHPAGRIRIEDLEKFDREPLSPMIRKRLALWKAGKWPSTEEAQRRRTISKIEDVALLYGIPMVIGSVISLGLWWVVIRKRPKEDRRAYIILAGILVFLPVPFPMVGWTTLAAIIVIFTAGLFQLNLLDLA